MLQKRLIAVCLMILTLLLTGCKSQPQEKSNQENSNQENSGDNGIFEPTSRSLDSTFMIEGNVYEAELIEIEKIDIYNYRIKVKVLFTYKGDLLPGEEIREDDLYVDDMSIEQFKVGAKYLFMTGASEDFKEDTYQLSYSIYRVVEILDDGGFKVFYHNNYSKDSGHNYKTYYDIVYDMLDLEVTKQSYRTSGFTGKRYYGVFDQFMLGEFFALADNVYIGEVLEVLNSGYLPEIGGEWEIRVLKVRVRVLSVLKGDYVPGQIIVDVIPNDGYFCNKSFLLISGDDFFEKYDEVIEDDQYAF